MPALFDVAPLALPGPAPSKERVRPWLAPRAVQYAHGGCLFCVSRNSNCHGEVEQGHYGVMTYDLPSYPNVNVGRQTHTTNYQYHHIYPAGQLGPRTGWLISSASSRWWDNTALG